MPLYEVQVTEERHTTIYVEAEDVRTAEDAALELSSVQDGDLWNEDWVDTDSRIVYADRLRSGSRIWTGGPQGHWRIV